MTVITKERHDDVSLTFQAMWLAAEEEFRQTTGRELKAYGAPGDLTTFVERMNNELNPPDEPDSESKRRRQKLTKIAEFVLGGVQTLGSIVGHVVTMVFGGPAEACFNAFSFLMEIPAKANKVYDDLITLFGHMRTTLLEFQVIGSIKPQANIDVQLMCTTNNILITFVQICARYYKFAVGGKRNALSVALKSVFLDDDCGVLDSLREFQDLFRRQSAMIGTCSYKHILNIEAAAKEAGSMQQQIFDNVQSLINSHNASKSEALKQESLDKIEQKLKARSAIANHQLMALQHMQSVISHDVSKWVLETPQYQDWVRSESGDHLLCIAGGKKSGKKYLLTAIACNLEKQDAATAADQSTKPVILYYDVSVADERMPAKEDAKDERLGSKKDPRADVTNQALKVLALQAASKNEKCAQRLRKNLDSVKLPDSRESSLPKMWETLGFSNVLASAETEVYIMLSGLDQLPADRRVELLGLLSKESNGSKTLRVLVTGQPRSFNNSLYRILTIDDNKARMRSWIEKEMKTFEVLQDSDLAMEEVRKKLLETLPDKVNGNFDAVRSVLKRVETAITKGKTQERVLDELSDINNIDADKLNEDKFKALQKDLSTDEIEELNLVLPWLVYCDQYMRTTELEAILLAYGRSLPLLSLEKRFRLNYSAILAVELGCVVMTEESRSWLKLQGKQSMSKAPEIAKISLEIKIDQADLATVRRFIWDLNERFIFDHPTFVTVSNDRDHANIGVSEADAHFAIVEKSLQFLSDDPDAASARWFDRSLTRLWHHLDLMLKTELAPEKRKVICQKVINFFSESATLVQKWRGISYDDLDMVSVKTLEIIEELFDTTKVPMCFEPIERRWIEKYVKSAGKPGAFLEPIAAIVAERFMSDRDWHADYTWKWIDAFIDLQNSRMSQADGQSIEGFSTNDDVATDNKGVQLDDRSRILRAAAWCTERRSAEKPTALYYERVASALLSWAESPEAISYLKKALELSAHNWRIHAMLARAYHMQRDPRKYKEELRAAITHHNAAPEHEQDEQEVAQLHVDLAKAERSDGYTEAAARHCMQAIKLDKNNRVCYWMYFCILCERGQFDEAVDLLSDKGEELFDEEPADKVKSNLSFVLDDIECDWYDDVLYWLSKVLGNPLVTDGIERLLHESSESFDIESKAKVLYSVGHLFGYSSRQETQERGMRCLNECIETTFSSTLDDDLGSSYWMSSIREVAIEELSLWRSLTLTEMAPGHSKRAFELETFFNAIEKVRKTANITPNTYYLSATSYRCRQLVEANELGLARDLLQSNLKIALVILEDDDEENDHIGFWMLAYCLLLAGDDANASTAFSLLAPLDLDRGAKDEKGGETTEYGVKLSMEESLSTDGSQGRAGLRPGPMERSCHGCALVTWQYADNFWVCKHCPDVQLCSNCFRLQKHGQLRKLMCHQKHEFFHVPPWSDETYLEVGKGYVRVDSQIDENGKRTRGRMVPMDEWKNSIRQIWKIESQPTTEG